MDTTYFVYLTAGIAGALNFGMAMWNKNIHSAAGWFVVTMVFGERLLK